MGDEIISGTSGTSGTSETMPPSGISGTSGTSGTSGISVYDTDDPSKLQLSWSTVNTWLDKIGVCSPAVNWVKERLPEFEKVKIDVEKTKGTYNMDSSIYVLEKFIEEKKHLWAQWFIVEIMTEKEYKSFVTYALEQIPKDIDKSNQDIEDTIYEAQRQANKAINDSKPSAAKRVIEPVVRINALHNPDMNTDDVFDKILRYGIDLIKQRNVK